jgi:hypothetical protein
VVLFGGLAKTVENDAGLDDGQFGSGVYGTEAVHVAGVIENDGDIRALAGEAGAGASGQDGGSGFAAGGESGLDVGGVARHDDAYGKLAVIRRVGGVEGAGGEVEADVAAESGFEEGFKLMVSGKCLMVERRLV